jgi:hypothetical protein
MLQVFQLFQTQVASVSSEYRKSKSGVAHVVMGPTCSSCWGAMHARGKWRDGSQRSTAMGAGSGAGWRQGHEQSPPVHAAGYEHELSPPIRAARSRCRRSPRCVQQACSNRFLLTCGIR